MSHCRSTVSFDDELSATCPTRPPLGSDIPDLEANPAAALQLGVETQGATTLNDIDHEFLFVGRSAGAWNYYEVDAITGIANAQPISETGIKSGLYAGLEYGICASCVSTGVGCGGLSLTCDSLPIAGSSLDVTLTGTVAGQSAGFGTVVLKLGPALLPGVPQTDPGWASNCFTYMGNGTLVTLGLTWLNSRTFSLAIPSGTGLIGLPLGLQGVALTISPFELRTSNAVAAMVGGS